MSLKTKILLLAILPLIAVTTAITMLSMKQARQLSEQEILTFEENLLTSKRNELKNYVSLAMTSIAHLLEMPDPTQPAIQARIKQVLNSLTYGEDSYFFVYSADGTNLVHPHQPSLVGQNLYDLQDRNGNYVIRNLLSEANSGGGYHRYLWSKPSKGGAEDKLSYVVTIPSLGWMMGTGLYIDDITRDIAIYREKVDHNIQQTFFTVLAIVAAATLVIILIGFIINIHATNLADKRLRELAQRYVNWQVKQRRRFARELHEGINQRLLSVKKQIEQSLTLQPLHSSDDTMRQLHQGINGLNETITEVQRISQSLRPSLLDDLGLEAALRNVADDFTSRNGVPVRLKLKLPSERLPDEIELALYRMAQEALSNIEQHANARQVKLDLWPEDNHIYLELEDDGQGFLADQLESSSGAGLRAMRERTELLSGSFELLSKPGQGTMVRAVFNSLPGQPHPAPDMD